MRERTVWRENCFRKGENRMEGETRPETRETRPGNPSIAVGSSLYCSISDVRAWPFGFRTSDVFPNELY